MRLNFTKMHALGNDFVLIDGINQSVLLDPRKIRAIADRRLGIGCDQVLLIEKSASDRVDFHYRIFNADGGEVEQCGNGARCFAKFVKETKLTDNNQMTVSTASGILHLTINKDDQVTVELGIPDFDSKEIFLGADEESMIYILDVGEQQVKISVVAIGNPHAVILVDKIEQAPVLTLGPQIENHPLFPQRVNVGFMELVNRKEIRLRVFERGVGETTACGSGACAAVIVGIKRDLLDEQVDVNMPGGRLKVEWQGQSTTVFLTGPTYHVFDGSINL